ncbi:alpha/beta hydrolase [Streptococcus henryi]|uniref:alpha/beta hydrolase n=1 Tax=Streptococcus henryi TaxID=439219 RepID=UPI000372F99C|nr:alpha/beta hydrolase [Streptococcus henryi]
MMNNTVFDIWAEDEYNYSQSFGFMPNLYSYLHEENVSGGRPTIIIVPGGAYSFVSPSEGDSVARKFYSFGYNAFVLTYTVNVLGNVPVQHQPMNDLSRAIRFLRANHQELNIHSEKIIICGFSAGGHLCGSLCTHYQDVMDNNDFYNRFSNRPDAAILCYPVVSTGKFCHEGSFKALLGISATDEEQKYFSLEKNITTATPPMFLWHTATDETVAVENSIVLASALKQNNVPFSYHIFSEGKHGLSTAEVLTEEMLETGQYTMKQTYLVLNAINNGLVPPSKGTEQLLKFISKKKIPSHLENKEAAIWTELVKVWLEKYILS